MKPISTRGIMRTQKGVFIILIVCLFSAPVFTQANPLKINALVLYSYHIEGKGSQEFDKGVRSAFKNEPSVLVKCYTEYMDSLRFTGHDSRQQLFKFYRSKYQNKKIDVIISYASPALDFLLRHGDEIFPGVPVVFGLVSKTIVEKRDLPDNYTGVLSGPGFAQTLNAALKLLPATKKVFIVGGTSPVDNQYFAIAKNQLKPFLSKIDIEYINHLGMEDLLKKVAKLPSKTIIIYSLLQHDANGKVFGPKNAARQIAAAASVPVFGISQTHLGTGIVGGFLNSTHLIGSESATTALNIVTHKKEKFLTHQGQTHAYMFDWHQLKRWRLNEKKLPPESTVLNKKVSSWEQYYKQIIAVIILIILETLLIALLLIHRSKRISTEQQLRTSETKYRSMMESITDPLVICSSDYTMEYMNPAMIKRLGRNAAGELCYQSMHGLDKPCEECILKKITEYKSLDITLISPLDDRQYRVTNMPIYNKDGSVSKMSIYRDITKYRQAVADKEKAQEQLRQAQKMKSIGTLAGGIAHDFNNILYPIMGFVQLSIDELPKDHPVQENLYDILDGANRASNLVKRILMFSRQKEQVLEPIDIKPVIEESLKLLRSSIPANIEIQAHYYDGTDRVLCDETEIHEIIMNLCTNSYHAMEKETGLIKIELNKIKPYPDIELPDGQYLCLSVSDDGTGIDSTIEQKIFEPYFTTKEVGKGSGLGLSVVHGIVKNYNGEIEVRSHPGKGTTFNIFLPVTSEKVMVNKELPQASAASGAGKILLVDDDESIVKLGKKALERFGYQVTGILSSLDALKRVKSNPDDFDLVITDMSMPGMVGTQLAGKILEVKPDMPIILCSGFSERLELEKARMLNIKAFIDKPILIAELTAKVKKILEESVSDSA